MRFIKPVLVSILQKVNGIGRHAGLPGGFVAILSEDHVNKKIGLVGAFFFLLLPVWIAGQAPGTHEGQPAVVLSNGKLELTVMKQGATLANLVLADDPEKLSPLWNPIRMARELGTTPLPASVGGHFVCVDGFGPVSPEERAAGLPNHGEAHFANLETRSERNGAAVSITLSGTLPIVQEVFTRNIRMVDGENIVYVESRLENLLGFDRPVNWAEHATIGSPFLESGATVVDVSGSRSRTRPWQQLAGNNQTQRRLASGFDFAWPMAPSIDGKMIDLRETPENPHYIDHSATLLDPSSRTAWVTAINLKRNLIIGWIFRREEYPWLQIWGNFPATGKMARGVEFSTQPFDVPRRDAVSASPLFDTPWFRWLPAKSRIETKFLLFYARIPAGFRKVDEVNIQNGRIRVADGKAQKEISLEASLSNWISR